MIDAHSENDPKEAFNAWRDGGKISRQLGAGALRADWLITAQSYLVDRFRPDCEWVRLPAAEISGGEITFEAATQSAPPTPKKKRLISRLKKAEPVEKVDGVCIDIRANSPSNWAHVLTHHLPIVFEASELTGLPIQDFTLIVPANIPAYSLAAIGLFGLKAHATDAVVTGDLVKYRLNPLTTIRNHRTNWAARPLVQAALDQSGFSAASDADLPERVFISRKWGRKLENEAEVEALLARRGFRKIYAEELSAIDQLRLLDRAHGVVGIHGAGIAPLMYRRERKPGAYCIELFPCGHMTDVWRTIAQQVDCRWVGVRGRIRAEHIPGIYKLGEPFLKFSLQDFEIDLTALTRALDYAEGGSLEELQLSDPMLK